MNYQKIYDSICQRGKDELEERRRKKKEGLEYYEGHHIIPKSMGGEGKASNWNHQNITPLTANEHLLVHKILCILYPNDSKLVFALWGMYNQKKGKVNREYSITNKEYERAKKSFIERNSGKNNPNFGGKNIKKGKDNWFYGKITSGAFKKGEEHPLYGKKGYWADKPKEEHPLVKNGFRGYGKDSPRAKKVIQIDIKTSKILGIFDAMAEAEIKTGVSQKVISDTCIGRQKTAGGFIWKYAPQELNK